MSSGADHARATTILTPIVGTAVAYFTQNLALGTLAAIGCYTGVVLSPDLDLKQITRSERIIMNKSRLLGFLFRAYWQPYGNSVPHRHIVSHMPIISTIGRIIYALAFPFILSLFLGFTPQLLAVLLTPYFLVFVLGLIVSDTAHAIMDIL